MIGLSLLSISAFGSMDCMNEVKPYEHEMNQDLPGNDSKAWFKSCNIQQFDEYTDIKVVAGFRLRQKACKWGRCVTLWSYSGDANGVMRLDGNCEIMSLRLWTDPKTPLLDRFIPQATEAVKRRLHEVWEKRPDLKDVCLR